MNDLMQRLTQVEATDYIGQQNLIDECLLVLDNPGAIVSVEHIDPFMSLILPAWRMKAIKWDIRSGRVTTSLWRDVGTRKVMPVGSDSCSTPMMSTMWIILRAVQMERKLDE